MEQIDKIRKNREELEHILQQLLSKIGEIQIGTTEQFPFGWRKAAKGRTVWRILEEAINQNLEKYQKELGFSKIVPATSEVGVYDFYLILRDTRQKLFVNIKSAVKGGKKNKDDISKAVRLIEFFNVENDAELYIASFEISFLPNMKIKFENCYIMPIMWLPDIYVNPSNNGNLQSSKYKEISLATERTTVEFVNLLDKEILVAEEKKAKKKK